MSIQNAVNFIQKAHWDNELRSNLNSISSNEISTFLKGAGYEFSGDEFEDAINLMHVKCQTEEDANLLFEVVWWFKMVNV